MKVKNWWNVKSWWSNWKNWSYSKELTMWKDSAIEWEERARNMQQQNIEANKEWSEIVYGKNQIIEMYEKQLQEVCSERDSYKAQLMDKQQEQEHC